MEIAKTLFQNQVRRNEQFLVKVQTWGPLTPKQQIYFAVAGREVPKFNKEIECQIVDKSRFNFLSLQK